MCLKIAIISEWFSEGMGYSENFFPYSLAKVGFEVYLITSDLQVYATSNNYDLVYKSKLGPKKVHTGTSVRDNVTLIRLKSKLGSDGIALKGLENLLDSIKPDIIHLFEINIASSAQAIKYISRHNKLLLAESRLHSSILPIQPVQSTKLNVFRSMKRKLIDIKNACPPYRSIVKYCSKFLPIAPDVARNIVNAYGISSSSIVQWSLGYDRSTFDQRISFHEKKDFRVANGFFDDDIICVYTGRLTYEKGPQYLVEAVENLNKRGHHQYKALFLGKGDPKIENLIKSNTSCQLLDFVPVSTLPMVYQSSDIGVWPLQESTSQLDAAASGIPIVVSNMVEDKLRYQGNGRTYNERSFTSLAEELLALKSKSDRDKMGKIGIQKMRDYYSWDSIAIKYRNLIHSLLINPVQ